jgi:hypothetical protein
LRQGARLPLRHRADRGAGQGFLSALVRLFEGTESGITEENLQSRARHDPDGDLQQVRLDGGDHRQQVGNVGRLRTLYGDMNGGFNPIKDLYKMQVYGLSRWRNAHVPPGALGPSGEVIPEHHRQGAVGRTAAQPDGPGFAAALSGARRYPRMPGRKGDGHRGDRCARP